MPGESLFVPNETRSKPSFDFACCLCRDSLVPPASVHRVTRQLSTFRELQFPTNVVAICLERPRSFPYDPAPMLDFEVQRCTRRCARTDRELTPGEPMYSALVSQGAEVVRQDFAADAWNGPPENALGWWKANVPDSQGPKVQWAPNDVMLNYFQQLETAEDRWDVRYVLALLLIRRRIARLEQTETDAEGREVLTLFCPRDEQSHRVVVVMPDQARVAEIQQELGKLLFSGGA